MMICKWHLRLTVASIVVLAAFAAIGGSVALAQDKDRQGATDADQRRNGSVAKAIPVEDKDIRAAFVGHEAHPPQPWPVSFGPYEFRSDGTYFRQQDLASAMGRYVIADGRICIRPAEGAFADECYKVLRDGSQYFLQDAAGRGAPFPVTLHPISDPANK
jgi:hypothetical protein